MGIRAKACSPSEAVRSLELGPRVLAFGCPVPVTEEPLPEDLRLKTNLYPIELTWVVDSQRAARSPEPVASLWKEKIFSFLLSLFDLPPCSYNEDEV